MTSTAKELLGAILTLEGGAKEEVVAEGGEGAKGAKAKKKEEGGGTLTTALEDLMERLPVEFNMVEVQERAEAKLKTEDAPFVLVALQECTNMNALLFEIRRGLDELQKGQNGETNTVVPLLHGCYKRGLLPRLVATTCCHDHHN